MATKLCPVCKENKSLDLFSKQQGRKDNLAWQCKSCVVDKVRQWRIDNPEKRGEQIIAWKHKLTSEAYNQKLADQNGVCAICKKPSDTRLAVDHDHSCCPGNGKTCGDCVRGLLCRKCNANLASVEDSVWLEAALQYLMTYKSK